MNPGAWYHEAADYVFHNGLMNGNGDGTFGPNDTLSRAMLAQILYNAAGGVPVNYLMQYNDVPADAWYTEAVRWATSEGIVSGYNGGYRPNDPITREQFAAMLYRYAVAKGMDVSVGENTNILSYADAFDISEWAYSALQWACGSGIISGRPSGVLDPTGHATRAEAAVMLMNFLSRLDEK